MHHSLKCAVKKETIEVQEARGRLKTALHDLVANSDDEVMPPYYTSKEKRGRPKKIKADSGDVGKLHSSYREVQDQQMHESFIMKLFDRSLDLSKYDETTSLYPICRAWMENTPRSPTIKSYRIRRSPSPVVRKNIGKEVLEELCGGNLNKITAMPEPLKTTLTRIPSNLFDEKYQEERKKTELSLKGASKQQLLSVHKQKWKKVRQNWQSHTKKYYELKYKLNFNIINELYKC